MSCFNIKHVFKIVNHIPMYEKIALHMLYNNDNDTFVIENDSDTNISEIVCTFFSYTQRRKQVVFYSTIKYGCYFYLPRNQSTSCQCKASKKQVQHIREVQSVLPS